MKKEVQNMSHTLLNPTMIREIAVRREKGISIAQITDEVGIHKSRYYKWRKDAINLVKDYESGKVLKLTKHQINLVNFLTTITDAEDKHAESLLKEYTENTKYKGLTQEELFSLVREKVLKSYD